MENKNFNYAWSFDKKYFIGGCSSVDEAVKEAKNESNGETLCYIGIEKEPTFNIDADNILEMIDEQYLDQSSEFYDGHLNHIKKEEKMLLENKLKESIKNWMSDTGNFPMFFTVTDIEEIVFEEYLNDKKFKIWKELKNSNWI